MGKRLAGTIAVGVLIIAGVADYASAFDQPIYTKISLIKPGRLYKIVSRGAFPYRLPTDNPSLTGGSLTVTANSTSLTCTLAAQAYNGTEGWKGLGNPAGLKGWKYLNKWAPGGGVAGDCKLVVIKESVIKVLAKGTGSLVVLGEGLNSDVAMQLTAGSASYCALATSPHLEEVAGSLLKTMKDEPPFKDNGDGTITHCTGLMWEKKGDAGGIHDVDNLYRWAGCCDGTCSTLDDYCQPNAAAAAACGEQTGGTGGCSECSVGACETWGAQTIWEWIVQVNAEGGSGFAGHSDWRIPSEAGCNDCYTDSLPYNCPCDPAELETILLEPYRCEVDPCVDPVFNTSCTPGCSVFACSCTASKGYWASSTSTYFLSSPGDAWFVGFSDGIVFYDSKYFGMPLRAVRGASPSGAFLDVTNGVLD